VKARRRPAKIKQAIARREAWRLQARVLAEEQQAAAALQQMTHRPPDRKD